MKGRPGDGCSMPPCKPCFNPRPREGATPRGRSSWAGNVCFNPRPREGATQSVWLEAHRVAVSIHAPVKGRPLPTAPSSTRSVVSIHAPVKGRPAASRLCTPRGIRGAFPRTYVPQPPVVLLKLRRSSYFRHKRALAPFANPLGFRHSLGFAAQPVSL